MGQLILINPKKLNIDFEDITAFDLINFLFNNDEYHGWEWCSDEDYEELRIDFLDMSDVGVQSVLVMDFVKEEIRLMDVEVIVKEIVRKTTTVTIKKVKSEA